MIKGYILFFEIFETNRGACTIIIIKLKKCSCAGRNLSSISAKQQRGFYDENI